MWDIMGYYGRQWTAPGSLGKIAQNGHVIVVFWLTDAIAASARSALERQK
jgi:hypothetical protein